MRSILCSCSTTYRPSRPLPPMAWYRGMQAGAGFRYEHPELAHDESSFSRPAWLPCPGPGLGVRGVVVFGDQFGSVDQSGGRFKFFYFVGGGPSVQSAGGCRTLGTASSSSFASH